MYKVELAVDLNELESKCKEREAVRNHLEKSVATCWAEMRRPTVWVRHGAFEEMNTSTPPPVKAGFIAGLFGYEVHDAIDFYFLQLALLNEEVSQLQALYINRRRQLDDVEQANVFDDMEQLRMLRLGNQLQTKTSTAMQRVSKSMIEAIKARREMARRIANNNSSSSVRANAPASDGNEVLSAPSRTIRSLSNFGGYFFPRDWQNTSPLRDGNNISSNGNNNSGSDRRSHTQQGDASHRKETPMLERPSMRRESGQSYADAEQKQQQQQQKQQQDVDSDENGGGGGGDVCDTIATTNQNSAPRAAVRAADGVDAAAEEEPTEEELDIMQAIVNTAHMGLEEAVTFEELRALLRDMKQVQSSAHPSSHTTAGAGADAGADSHSAAYSQVPVAVTGSHAGGARSNQASFSSPESGDAWQSSKQSWAAHTRHASIISSGAELVGTAGDVARSGLAGVAHEGAKTAELAAKGAIRSVLEVTRALELLTFGAYYRISSTAFVTFRTLVAKSSAHQMLLSHEHYGMIVHSAPNPKDVIWDNVAIFQRQIDIRKMIADGTLIVGAIFWSIVVTFIFAISNLTSIAEVLPFLRSYSDTSAYILLNTYLAIIVLLILLSILPFLFDFISRHYEGLKLESEIQNSIMTRYFYYQLANIYVSVGLGSIASSLHSILNNPANILSILGASVPSFSIYFANLVIVKTLTALPLEMLRVFPLLDITLAGLLYNKRKLTRRELRTGSFAPLPMLYGWIYPNLLMVLMIMLTYACVSFKKCTIMIFTT